MINKTLNILSCESAFYAIKDFKNSDDFFDNDDFLIVDLPLFVGDISNLENGTIREFNKHKFSINHDILNNLSCYNSIRIWSSRLDTGDYLSMLYCLSLIKDRDIDIKIIFTDDLKIKEKNGKEYKIKTLSCCLKEEVSRLLKLENLLSSEHYKKYIDEWNKAIIENASLRIMHNGVLIGTDYDFLDKYIFEVLKEKKQMTKMQLCVEVMMKYTTELGNMGDIIIMTRIDQLINNNKIKITEIRKPEFYRMCEIISEENYSKNCNTVVAMK